MKYFVFSDIHDHYSLFKESLNNNGFDEDNDNHKIILCGDAFVFGNESGKLFEYLRNLSNKNKLIYVFGNHDLTLVDNIKNGKFNNYNRICVSDIVNYLTGLSNLSDQELVSQCDKLKVLDFFNMNLVPYYETNDYIFVHGFIPTKKNRYIEDWRNFSIKEFMSSTIKDGMVLSMRYKVFEPNKKIVFGHYSAARCKMMESANEDEWNQKIYKNVTKVPTSYFKIYYSDTFISMDQSVKKTNFLNCFIFEE